MMTFDTTEAVVKERHDYWRTAISTTFVPLECDILDGDFYGRLQARSLADIALVEVCGAPQTVKRTRNTLWRYRDDLVLLSLVHQGRTGVVQCGRETALCRGEFALYDTRAPYELHLNDAFRQMVVQFPREHLQRRLGRVDDLTAIGFGRGHPLSGLTADFLSGLFQLPETLPKAQQRHLAEQAIDLVTTIIADGCHQSAQGPAAGALLCQVKILIDDRLSDPDLSIGAVARQFNVTPRYLSMLFQKEGQTFGRYLLARRPRRCANTLRERRAQHGAVSDIAYRWGFSDPAYFSREFKKAFGMTPREWRQVGPGLVENQDL